jgi:hypothetical protein
MLSLVAGFHRALIPPPLWMHMKLFMYINRKPSVVNIYKYW